MKSNLRPKDVRLDAMIFDFDGVVVDSEPVHLACFQQVLSGAGVTLTVEEYYTKYIGFDDHDCFKAALRDHGASCSEGRIAEMIARKTVLVQKAYSTSIEPLPGAAALIRSAAAAGIPVGVCSGALLEEIRLAARTVGVLDSFLAIVPAEDVQHGKPDPEGYRLALHRLSEAAGRALAPESTLVVEDSPAGIAAAKALGMCVLAVTNSYAPDALPEADRIVSSLAEVTVPALEELLRRE